MAARLSQIDRKILRMLQNNARISNNDISLQLKIAPSTVTKHIQKLTESGVITGYKASVQAPLIGFETVSFALIRCPDQSNSYVDELIETLKSSPGVAEIYKILGDDDFMVKIYARNNDEYQSIIEKFGDGHRDGHHIKTIMVTQIPYSGGLGAVVDKDDRQTDRSDRSSSPSREKAPDASATAESAE